MRRQAAAGQSADRSAHSKELTPTIPFPFGLIPLLRESNITLVEILSAEVTSALRTGNAGEPTFRGGETGARREVLVIEQARVEHFQFEPDS